jgi:hypothetical protein
MRTTRRVAACLGLVVALALGNACGDDDDVPEGGSETPPSVTSPVATSFSPSPTTIAPPELSTSSTRM